MNNDTTAGQTSDQRGDSLVSSGDWFGNETLAAKVAIEFWRLNERAVIDKYRIETIRHAANAIFNKIGEAYYCGLQSEQGKTALFDAQDLADVIVKSHTATERIGYLPNQ